MSSGVVRAPPLSQCISADIHSDTETVHSSENGSGVSLDRASGLFPTQLTNDTYIETRTHAHQFCREFDAKRYLRHIKYEREYGRIKEEMKHGLGLFLRDDVH